MKQKEKDAVLIELRGKGYTYREIQEITGRDQHNIRKRCIQLGIAYDPSEDHSGRKPEEQFAEELKALNLGIEYVSGYENNQSTVTVRHEECCHTFTWHASNARKHSYVNGVQCPVCVEIRKEQERKEKENATRRQQLDKLEALAKERISLYFKRRTNKEIRRCGECGKQFVAVKTTNRKFCSTVCYNRQADRRKRQKRDERIRNRKHYESLDLGKLYEMHRGICALCGEETDWNDYEMKLGSDGRETFVAGDRYPSIDHIVPLSKGGENVWDNAQLAHRLCNSFKGSA